MAIQVKTRIVRVDPIKPDVKIMSEVAKVIREGGLVVFPTETVYGLGANAYNPEAVVKIFKAKNRPLDNPLIVHISSLTQFDELVSKVPEEAYIVAKRLWPGPVTIIVYKSSRVPNEVTAGLPTVAVRMPAHPVALKLIELSGTPIAAPSANLAGRPSPTMPEHVIRDMYGRVDVIIDAGETLFGVESTIIDLTSKPPKLLRPGPIPVEDLERVLGIKIEVPGFARGLRESERALAPGTKYRHYAPEKPLVLVEADSYDDIPNYALKVKELVLKYLRKGLKVCILASKESVGYYKDLGVKILTLGSRGNLYEIAKNLFKVLRAVDDLNIDIVISEGFEERGLGLTIMNRLRKASGYSIVRV
ncbi:MAG TPA: threonylcarbamoyl-AMP synthase [Acidilobales archaeon]|nr:threonylcarbamoyl-AMP synthase [Acidilobales archaeon]